ncbi:MAG: hypothetical protein ACTIJ9_11365 [Aequorivita sp.]
MILNNFVNNPIIILVFLTNSSGYSQQSSSLDFFDNSDYEKVTISYYFIRDRTFYPPPASKLIPLDSLESTPTLEISKAETIKEIHKKTGEAELTEKEVKKLIKKMRKKLIPIYAMDTNKNFEIDFYRNDTIFQNITISPYTKNLYVRKEGCKNIKYSEGYEYDPCIYRGQMTPEFERYIYYLLKKKSLISYN